MRYPAFLLMLLLVACSEEGTGPIEQRTVPNTSSMESLTAVPVEELASSAELLELQEEALAQASDLEAMEDLLNQKQPLPPPDEPEVAEVAELEPLPSLTLPESTIEPDPKPEVLTAEAFRERILSGQPLKPLPEPRDFRRYREADPLLDRKNRKSAKKAEAKAKPKPERKRVGGGQAMRARTEENGINSLIPPAHFFKARLIGNVTVTLMSPTVFAEILSPEGRVIGQGVGTAVLHRYQTDRALVRFDSIILDDGRQIRGGLEAYEADLSLGLRGKVQRHAAQRVVLSVVETFLAALSLEVDTGSDSFGSVFKFQLAENLLKQADNRLKEIDLKREISLKRDMTFWVASTTTTSTSRDESVNWQSQEITTEARNAFKTTIDSGTYSDARKAELRNAYQRLSEKLKRIQ